MCLFDIVIINTEYIPYFPLISGINDKLVCICSVFTRFEIVAVTFFSFFFCCFHTVGIRTNMSDLKINAIITMVPYGKMRSFCYFDWNDLVYNKTRITR